MASPIYRPAGLLVSAGRWRVMLDGGLGAEPDALLDAWLVFDADSELRIPIRRLAAARGLEPVVAAIDRPDLSIQPRAVVHTSHPMFGYLIEGGGRRVVWVPEFMAFPDLAAGADLMFAEAAGWAGPIRFARGTGGHAPALEVGRRARQVGVRRLVFAHIGRPTLRAGRVRLGRHRALALGGHHATLNFGQSCHPAVPFGATRPLSSRGLHA